MLRLKYGDITEYGVQASEQKEIQEQHCWQHFKLLATRTDKIKKQNEDQSNCIPMKLEQKKNIDYKKHL